MDAGAAVFRRFANRQHHFALNDTVHDQLILTLRKSNIPAYAAPTLEAKKVGSLSKYTQLNIIGTWDDFYIVSLRDAAAFIPMDAAVWTSAELDEWAS